MKQKDIITPTSMLNNNTDEVMQLSKRLTKVENLFTAFMKKMTTTYEDVWTYYFLFIMWLLC
jgi:hypothetical protein